MHTSFFLMPPKYKLRSEVSAHRRKVDGKLRFLPMQAFTRRRTNIRYKDLVADLLEATDICGSDIFIVLELETYS